MEEIKRIKIKGVTGIRYLGMLDRLDGRRDQKCNQVQKVEGGVTTPRLVQKCRCSDEYTNEIYLAAIRELDGIYTDIAVSIEELRRCNPETDARDIAPATDNATEEGKRQAAARRAKRKAKEHRIEELSLHLAELRQKCHNIDEVLQHNMDRAKSVLHSHVENYWAGVLQEASAEAIPVFPVLPEESLSGKDVYIEHRGRIMKLLDDMDKRGEAE